MANTDLHVIGEFGIFSEICFILCILRFSVINLKEIGLLLPWTRSWHQCRKSNLLTRCATLGGLSKFDNDNCWV